MFLRQRPSKRPTSSAPARLRRAVLDALESRLLLANWINASGGDFNTASNWDTNAVPTTGENANITLAGAYTVTLNSSTTSLNSVTVSGGATLVVSSTTLSLDSASAVGAASTLSLANTTINGTGSLTNSGLLVARATDSINTAFATGAGSTLRVQGNSTDLAATLTVASGFTNNGTIELTSSGSAQNSTLTVTSGTLTNAATRAINALGGTGGTRTLAAQLNNQGTISAIATFTIAKASAAHTNSGTFSVAANSVTVSQSGTTPSFTNTGAISIAASAGFSVTAGTFNQNAGSITGAGSLLILNATANFQTSFSNATTALAINGSTVNGPGTIVNAAGKVLTLANTIINGPLSNSGILLSRGTGDQVNGTLTAAAGSTIRIQGNSTFGHAALTIANGFTNNGAIDLTGIDAAWDSSLTVTTGTLTNPATRTITTTIGTGGAGGSRALNAQLSNAGSMTLNAPLTMTRAEADHTNSGTISVLGGDLTVVQSGVSPSFINSGAIIVATGRTLTITGSPLTHSGGSLQGAGTIVANISQSGGNLDPNKPGTGIMVFHEPFNYTAGSQLNGQGGWNEPGLNDPFSADYQTPEIVQNGGGGSNSLISPNLLATGRSVYTSGFFSYDNVTMPSFIGAAGTTQWVGFMIRKDTNGTGGGTNPDYGGIVLGNGPDAANVFIGKPGTNPNWSLEVSNGSQLAPSSTPMVLGTTAFLVAKIDFTAGVDTVRLYVNPTPGAAEGSLVQAAQLSVELFNLNLLAMSAGSGAHWSFDEIRIGSGFADVAPRATGQTIINGNLTQSAGSIYTADIAGATAGTNYDQLVVNGSVTVAGALTLNGTFTPAGFQTFTLIDNDGADAVIGTYTGLAEGATFQVNGRNYRISYVGGTGNDVTVSYLPALTINDVTVTEGTGGTKTATFTVTLSDAGSAGATVNWQTNIGTALAPDDYTGASGMLTFNPFVTTQQINVNIVTDALDENNETYTVTLSGATNGIITDSSGLGTITDDDPPPNITINDVTLTETNSGTQTAQFTVSLSAVSSKTVTVNAASAAGTATAGADYVTLASTPVTFLPGQTTQTVNVTVNSDALDENDETYFVNLSGASNGTITDSQGLGTINDDDPMPNLSINDVTVTEGTGGTVNATFTVTLSTVSGRAVTMNASTANSSAVAPGDFTALNNAPITINAGSLTQTFNVVIAGDTVDEDNETYLVNLSNVANANVTDSQGQGTINDNDAPPTVSIDDVAVNEGNSGSQNATFTVSLSAASEKTITLNASTANNSAIAPGDYAAVVNFPITFNPGQTTQNVVVTVNGDLGSELNETYFVNLSNLVNATVADGQGLGTINDNESFVTASLAAVSPNPRGTDLSSLDVHFSEPVNGFDMADLSLSRDGQSISLTGASLSTSDNMTWTINGLSTMTANAGNYVLTLNSSGAGITGIPTSRPLTSNATAPWEMNAINGTSGPDSIRLIYNTGSSRTDVFINNVTATPDYSLDVATLSTLYIYGNDDDDVLTIDFTAGSPLPAAGAAWDGVTGSDTVHVIGGGADTFTFSDGQVTRTAGNGGSLLIVSNEIIRLDGGAYSTSSDLSGASLIAAGASVVTLGATQNLAALDVQAGALVTLASGGDKYIITSSLTVAGKLDLKNNDLIVDYTGDSPLGTWTGTEYSGITGLIASARNGGAWDGLGITSSSAEQVLTTLVIGEATHVLGISGSDTGVWQGQTVDATTVLVKFSYTGDVDLNGQLDGDDYFYLDSNILQSGMVFGHHVGDFDLNGELNGDDYFLIDSNILQSQGEIL